MKSQSIQIEEALVFARDKGLEITRRGVFNWCQKGKKEFLDIPCSCNALGAILFFLGKENLAKYNFDPSWLITIKNHLGVDDFWLFKFNAGFENGKELLLIHEKYEERCAIGIMGKSLANRYVK